MKICVVGLRGFPNVMGGIETHCQQLYSRLAKRFDVTVVARSPYVPGRYDYQGVNIVPVWTVKNKSFETIVHTFLAILYARIFVKPHILHIHGIGPGLMAPFARLLGLKVVVTHHGADYQRAKWGKFARWVLRTGERLSIRYANLIIVVGNSLTRTLQVAHPKQAGKLLYVPNGAALANAGSGDLAGIADFGLEEKGYILTVGRLVPEKGFHDLIEAHRKSGLELPLVVVGAADHEDSYSRELINSGGKGVIFTGRQEGKALFSLYRNARLFVLPSYHEGLPIVALEAMSVGLPVLLSDIEPNMDLGLTAENYFSTGNIDNLETKLRSFSDIPVAAEHVVSRFDWDKIAYDVMHLYFGMMLSDDPIELRC